MNLWLFFDPDEKIVNSIETPKTHNITDSPAKELSTVPSIDHHVIITDESVEPVEKEQARFDFNPVDVVDIQPQLKAQKEIVELKKQLEKARERAQNKQKEQNITFAKLVAENEALTNQVSTLENQNNIQTANLAESQVRERKLIDKLDKERQRHAKLLNTPIDTIKGSIEQKKDLLKVKKGTELTAAEQHEFSDEALDIQDNHIQTDTVDSEEEKLAKVEHFTGAVEFGFNYDQDNQITKGLMGRLILDYDEADQYNINSDLQFEFKSENGEMITEKLRWQLQADYNLDPENIIFARSDIQRSQFASYEKEDTFTVGYGYLFFEGNNHQLNIEVGPGYKFAVPNIPEEAVSVNELILRTRLNYERVVSENLQLVLEGVVELGRANSAYSLQYRAQNRIYRQLYLIFDLNYKYNQNVPVDTVNKEVSTGLNLMYAF
ncbi:DUF481 domain-containing protein [Psychromonas sp.]|nr:DUF481 domain-containing protein [Psychromonas sp.]